MDKHSVQIKAGQGYKVSVGSGLLTQCGQDLAALLPSRRIAIITDSTVEKLYLPAARSSLEQAGFQVSSFSFPAGESSKTIYTLAQILEFLAAQQLTRQDCLAALGGGVVGDITGFAAGCYLRGIHYVQLPTTLLAAVDSSVGGKTAVDLRAGKNLAGLFIQPAAVICDTDCLATLPPAILADGMAEAVKTAILSGEAMFARFESGQIEAQQAEMILDCVRCKGAIVEADEFENGPRQLLNLGHTIGHAVEKCSNYQITHGHAVAIGTAIISRAAERLGFCRLPLAQRIEAVLRRCNLPIHSPFGVEELAAAALVDKKRRGNKLTLVIPHSIGDCRLHQIEIGQLATIIQAGMEDWA